MLSFLNMLSSMVRDRIGADADRGATAVEYGLMVALIAAVIVGAVIALGGEVNDAFETVVDAIP